MPLRWCVTNGVRSLETLGCGIVSIFVFPQKGPLQSTSLLILTLNLICIVDLKFLIRPAIVWVHLKRKTRAFMNTLASLRVKFSLAQQTHTTLTSGTPNTGVLWQKVLPEETGSSEKKEGEKEAEKKVESKPMKFDSDDDEDYGNDVDMDLAETTTARKRTSAITHLAPLNNNVIGENSMWAWQCSLIEENQIEGYDNTLLNTPHHTTLSFASTTCLSSRTIAISQSFTPPTLTLAY